MPLVSWISPVLSWDVASSSSKISGVRMYRPMMARFDVASSRLGFSTRSRTVYTPPDSLSNSTMP